MGLRCLRRAVLETLGQRRQQHRQHNLFNHIRVLDALRSTSDFQEGSIVKTAQSGDDPRKSAYGADKVVEHGWLQPPADTVHKIVGLVQAQQTYSPLEKAKIKFQVSSVEEGAWKKFRGAPCWHLLDHDTVLHGDDQVRHVGRRHQWRASGFEGCH